MAQGSIYLWKTYAVARDQRARRLDLALQGSQFVQVIHGHLGCSLIVLIVIPPVPIAGNRCRGCNWSTGRGELSKSAVDRGWPHQVAVQSSVCVAEAKAMQEFCIGLSIYLRARSLVLPRL